MLPPVPYLGLAGYEVRSKVAPSDVAYVAQQYPGFIERRSARGSSWINARLQKRYRVPLGQEAPTLVAVGTAPPTVILSGRPVRGDLEMAVEVLTAGAIGASTYWWSDDGGTSWSLGPTLAASGTTPPVVTIDGLAAIGTPDDLQVRVTTAGSLGTARFQWSTDAGATWTFASAMASSGTHPPGVSLSGTSTATLPADIQIQITTGGALGTAIFQWSQDGGATWTTGLPVTATPIPLGATGLTATFSLGTYATDNAYQGQGLLTASAFPLGATGLTLGFSVGTYSGDNAYEGQGIVTAATAVLGATGLTATFPAGTYSADNAYSAATPVPEIVLGWLVAMLDVDVWERRGVNPQDPTIATAILERTDALAELKEAADSKEGLFDLPTIDTQGDSAIRHGGPLSYTEVSPYVSADHQEFEGRQEDIRRFHR